MDIKKMHEMIETLVCCAKAEFDKKGIEQIDAEEMSKVTDMIKDLAEAQYYRTLVVAMEDAEYGEDYDHEGPMGGEHRKGYRGQPRSSRTGRYMRRGYDHMMPMDDMEYMRDMDRGMGRMYYTGGGQSGSSGGGSQGMSGGSGGYSGGGQSGGMSGGSGGSRGYSEGQYGGVQNTSRSENARRGYEETKKMGDSSPEGKKRAMESLENYMKELSEDMTELVGKMDTSEKNMLRTKLQALAQKIQ